MLSDLPANTIFQHDGARPHDNWAVQEFVDKEIWDPLMERKGPGIWLARSSDLTII